jgi:hypothetical protein
MAQWKPRANPCEPPEVLRQDVSGDSEQLWGRIDSWCEEQCLPLGSTGYTTGGRIIYIWVNYNDLTATEPWNHG